MKQNITALIIFTLIISGSLISLNFTKNIFDKIILNQKLSADCITNDDWIGAAGYTKATKTLWDKYHPRLAIMLSHQDLNDINDLIVSVTSLVMLNDKKAFITENKRLMALVENLGKKDILTFENLF